MPPADGARWYQDAILYELHVRAFHDSDADGIGDFRGLLQKLDHLAELGVTAIWLLPFYPSPLRDDGYDIADYTSIHPSYGSLRDFRTFLREAHRRGLKVITELVMNHTSDEHPWFRRARRAAPGTPARDFYVWSDTPERYADTRIIFKDFEASNWAWDHEAQAYYWHRFYSHQPDLNFDNPEVRAAMLRVVDFWLDLGVDGLRLDAVPYLFQREGTSGENLPETHAFLKELRAHVDERHTDRMLLAEANQWPEDAVSYLGEGDECHMAFHFPLMPRMFMALRMEDRFPVIDILEQTPPIPDAAQWALFLRNHDELTLEMVTDEERDYMYRVYAQDPQARVNLGIRRRLAPLLGNDRRVIEMINGLLFSLPGTPVIYYGDEIGMGDNIYLGDRNGVRTPMQWSADRNAGFSRANPQQLYLPVVIDPEYHFEAVNVEAQQNNPASLLWWMRRLIALRKRHPAFGRGSIEFLYPDNRKILVFLRSLGEQRILVVVNLSRSVQYVELDLSRFRGMVPSELFGATEFPPIGELPYFLTLGPYSFYWFDLQPQEAEEIAVGARRPPAIEVAGAWHTIFGPRNKVALEEVLPAHLRGRRWFGGKARRVKEVEILDAVPIHREPSSSRAPRALGFVCPVRVDYAEGDPETYVLTLACASVERTPELVEHQPHRVVARLHTREGERALHEALIDEEFCEVLLEGFARRRRFAGSRGKLEASRTGAFRSLRGRDGALEPILMDAEQSNSSVVYGDRLVLKIFRRVDPGINPDLEIGTFLTERAGFEHIPLVAGGLEYRAGRDRTTLGILAGYVPNEGDAWAYTLDVIGPYLERSLAHPEDVPMPEVPEGALADLAVREVPPDAADAIGAYLEVARVLGQRTAQLHAALASDREDPSFAPQPVSTHDRRSLYQSMRATANRVFPILESRRASIDGAEAILDLRGEVLARFQAVLDVPVRSQRIRTHGDFHLGQVLYTGRDFVIIDFEGEPARPIGERRLKRVALRDVAGMLRSFHYAAFATLQGSAGGFVPPEDPAPLEPWMHLWYRWVAATYLAAYQDEADGARFAPGSREELDALLDAFLLEKALYEIGYEANNRPDWVAVPMRGVLELLGVTR